MCTGLSGYKPVSLNMCNRRKEKEKKTMIWEESMCNTLKARRPTNSVFILQTLRLLKHSPEHTIQLCFSAISALMAGLVTFSQYIISPSSVVYK